jgi:beta-lactam-binding protein with PASTA domain
MGFRRRQPPPPPRAAAAAVDQTSVTEYREPGLPPPEPAGPPPPEEPPPWLGREIWPWLGALVVVVVVGLLVWLLFFRTSDRTTVPRVVGLGQAAAVKRLNDKGFDAIVVRRPAQRPAGIVVSQSPGSGTQLKKGQNVVVNVSTGPVTVTKEKGSGQTPTAPTPAAPQIAVPDVVGKQQAAGAAEIEAAGLVPGSAPSQVSQAAGTIVSQSPSAGTKLPAGESVNLIVSSGTASQPTVAVPSLTGKKAADARAALWDARLTGRTVYEAASGDKVGTVLRQQPGPGKAPAWTQITLYVGRAG